MNKRVVVTVAGMCVVAVIFFLTGSFMREATTERASEPYAGGKLIDEALVDEPLIDAYGEELAKRLVALASGEQFTDEQLEELTELVANQFVRARHNWASIGWIEQRLDKLEEL